MIAWIRDDREIDAPELDMFGHNVVARRIARRLSADSSEEPPTMAVVGALGSGKTSIRRLVAHHLSRRSDVRLTDVSLWPFDSPEAAVRGILGTLLKELSLHVNPLPVAGISGKYLAAVEKVSGRWAGLAGLAVAERDPEAILRRLATVIRAIGIRIVLWIEDLERFSGAAGLSRDEAAVRDTERLGPVRALLYLLDRCGGITVVVADTSLRSRFDLDKIARFVERPPRVETMSAWNLIGPLRQACLSGTPKPVIDPAAPHIRERLKPPKSVAEASMLTWRHRPDEPGVHEAVILLLDTPRSLKNALRITYDTWETLSGEIDFDDILLMSVIRAARPNVFAFVDQNIDDFRRGFRSVLGDDGPAEHSTFKELEKVLMREPSEVVRNAIRTLLGAVFLALPDNTIQHDHERIYIDKPQGLDVDRHVDYWARYLAVPEINEKSSDQAAIRAIEAWQSQRQSDLLERVVDSERSDQIESFVRMFVPNDLCRFLQETVANVKGQSAESWDEPIHPPGIVPVWRIMLRRPPDETELAATVEHILGDLVGANLPLVASVCYYFVRPAPPPMRILLSDLHHKRVGERLSSLLRETYAKGSGKQLLASLNGGPPDLLALIFRYLNEIRGTPSGDLPTDWWGTFADVIVEAAELDPIRGLPQIVAFITQDNYHIVERVGEDGSRCPSREIVVEFDEAAAERLFGLERICPLLAKAEIPAGLGAAAEAGFNVARDAARRRVDGDPA